MERPNFADYFEINMIEWFNYKKTENKKEMTNMNEVDCWQLKFKSCTYSNALLNKLSLINEQTKDKINFLEIKKAIYYAQKYHGTQTRQSGEPYYMHPLMVAEMVAPHCFKTDILVVSILHDTLEDTVLTKDMLEYIFDANVASKVDDLTRVKSDRKISAVEIMRLLWIQEKYELLLIKWFDRLHNIQTVGAKSLGKKFKIIKETLEKFMSLGMYLGSNIPNLNTDIMMVNLCYQQLMPYYHHQTINLMKSCEDTFDLPSLFVRNVKIHTKTL